MPFEFYNGDLIGLPVNDNHIIFRWISEIECKVLFSAAKKGKALSCHFASDKRGLRHLKRAIDEFVNFAFDCDKTIDIILAKVIKPSIGRLLLLRCDFVLLAEFKEFNLYGRYKNGIC